MKNIKESTRIIFSLTQFNPKTLPHCHNKIVLHKIYFLMRKGPLQIAISKTKTHRTTFCFGVDEFVD